MRIELKILLSLSLLALLYQPSTAISSRLRHWKGLLLFPKSKCHIRCVRKHGFFKDDKSDYYLASVPKLYVVKCQCMVSRNLRALITTRFGTKVAKSYGRSNFFGYTRRGREKLHVLAKTRTIPPIEFVTWEEFRRIVKQREATESRVTSATAETATEMETYEELKRIKAQWESAEAMARAAGETAVTNEELQRIVAQRKAAEVKARTAAITLARQRSAAQREAAEARAEATAATPGKTVANEELQQRQAESAEPKVRVSDKTASTFEELIRQILAENGEAGNLMTFDDPHRMMAQRKIEMSRTHSHNYHGSGGATFPHAASECTSGKLCC